MSTFVTRFVRHALVACAVMVGLASCEPTSGTDREKRRELWRESEADWLDTLRLPEKMRQVEDMYAQHFVGRVQPGVGCEICPDMCKSVDLRPLPVARFLRLYRKAVHRVAHPRSTLSYHLWWLQVRRLGCIAHDSGPALQAAWLALLDPGEDMAIRYFVAMQAVEYGIDVEAGRQSLHALAAGSGVYAGAANSALMDWDEGTPPVI